LCYTFSAGLQVVVPNDEIGGDPINPVPSAEGVSSESIANERSSDAFAESSSMSSIQGKLVFA